MNERMRSAVFEAALAVIGVAVLSGRAEANWRWTEAGCTWDSNTEGPDECDPNLPTGQVPQATPETVPQFEGQLSDGAAGRAESAALEQAVRSCRAYTKQGNVGYITVQVNPADGSLQWGAYMYSALDNFGWWTAAIYVNGGPIAADTKNQPYPPHASLPSFKAPPGSMIFITVQHLYFTWAITPIYIPEWGWTWTGSWVPGLAYGNLQCVVPLKGI